MKYKLTKNKIEHFGIILYQIEVVEPFLNLKKGDKGGYIESEKNLSQIGDAWVSDNAWVSGNAQVYGDAWVSGNAQVSGNAKILQKNRVLTGFITKSLEDLRYSLIAQIGIIPENKIILYKRVNKIKEGKYQSVYDKDFFYEDGKVSEVKDYEKSNASCGKGIHLSTPLYWNEGDTLIKCEVNFEDIITIQDGKVRAKKCKCLGEVNI